MNQMDIEMPQRQMRKSEPKALPPVDLLHALLLYDPQTGDLRWKKNNRLLQTRRPTEYRRVTIGKSTYKAHRIIFKMQAGHDPLFQIDHINGIMTDNRWVNLRDATGHQNASNIHTHKIGASGIPGVCKGRPGKGWRSQISCMGKKVGLGVFDTLCEAQAAYFAARRLKEVIYGK